jgi:hypothetical protein
MCALIAQRSIGTIPRWRLTKHCQRNVNFATFSDDNSGTEPPRVQLRAPSDLGFCPQSRVRKTSDRRGSLAPRGITPAPSGSQTRPASGSSAPDQSRGGRSSDKNAPDGVTPTIFLPNELIEPIQREIEGIPELARLGKATGHEIRDLRRDRRTKRTLSGLKVGTPIAIHAPNGVVLGHFSDTGGDRDFGSLGHGSRTGMVARSRFSASY